MRKAKDDFDSLLTYHKSQFDNNLTDVMPSDWIGNARAVVNEAELSDEKAEKVLKHTTRIIDKKEQFNDSAKVAEKVIEKLE